jgi:hypothetical protein
MGGPGALQGAAECPGAFADAIKRKLILEKSGDFGARRPGASR